MTRSDPHTPYTLRALYQEVCTALKNFRGEVPLEARLLIQGSLGLAAADVITQFDLPLNAQQVERVRGHVARRLKHEPLSRILEKRGFWNHSFKVTSATLDPRPDSETLIETVLECLPDRQQPLRLLDLGTGTGCLIITLLTEYPNAQGWAVDCSPEALAVAQENAVAMGVASRFQALQGFWEALSQAGTMRRTYDVILSNPPYIPSAHVDVLDPEVRFYDPRQALDGGADGLEAYRSLAEVMPAWSHPGTWVFLEIGYDQHDAVLNIFMNPLWHHQGFRKDLGHKNRVVFFKKA